MLGLRETIDRQPRTKKVAPAHASTGVVSRACSQRLMVSGTQRPTGTPNIGNIASRNTGSVNAAAAQKRTVIRPASPSSSDWPPARGSKSMPHLGQDAGVVLFDALAHRTKRNARRRTALATIGVPMRAVAVPRIGGLIPPWQQPESPPPRWRMNFSRQCRQQK